MIIYSLSNEVWKLESKLEMFQKQLEIKNVEMEKVNDKVSTLKKYFILFHLITTTIQNIAL